MKTLWSAGLSARRGERSGGGERAGQTGQDAELWGLWAGSPGPPQSQGWRRPAGPARLRDKGPQRPGRKLPSRDGGLCPG